MLACEAEFRLELAAIEDEGLGDPALNRLVPRLSFGQAGQGALDERLGFPAYLYHRHSTTDRNKGNKKSPQRVGKQNVFKSCEQPPAPLGRASRARISPAIRSTSARVSAGEEGSHKPCSAMYSVFG